eukprot:XP_001705241.1 Hypothetical protein GL50803_10941 [Giardia lamblia ATCC 50803]
MVSTDLRRHVLTPKKQVQGPAIHQWRDKELDWQHDLLCVLQNYKLHDSLFADGDND